MDKHLFKIVMLDSIFIRNIALPFFGGVILLRKYYQDGFT